MRIQEAEIRMVKHEIPTTRLRRINFTEGKGSKLKGKRKNGKMHKCRRAVDSGQ